MARNYDDFPFPEFKHAIKSGKNTYRNKFFHDIDLSFLLKWMESIEGENYTIRIVGDKLQLIDGEGQVVSEVTLSEGQQGPPGVTPNVSAAAFVDAGTGTPSVSVVKSGTTENPTFSFNFSNLKGAKGDTGEASTVPGPAGTPFQVKAQYDTYAEMIAAHPTGQVGDAYQVGQNSGLATVATTGDYDDLINKPTIPTVNNPTITITQGGVTKGSFTLNQSSAATIDVDAGGGGGSYDIESMIVLATVTDHATQTTYHNFVNGSWSADSSYSLTQNEIEHSGIVETLASDQYMFTMSLNFNTDAYIFTNELKQIINSGVLTGKYVFTTYPTKWQWFEDVNGNNNIPDQFIFDVSSSALNIYAIFNNGDLHKVNMSSISDFISAFKGIWFEQT